MSLNRKKNIPVLLFMFLLLLITAVFSLLIGRFDISIKECFGILWSKLFPIEPYWTKVQHNMLVLVRLPRIIIAILVGASLSVAGTSYQCIFRNPMCAPDILGASTGAAFGASLAILLGKSNMTITMWAFLSSLACVLLVLLVSRFCRGNQILNLILAGIMVGSIFSAGNSYIKMIADPNNVLPAITYWLMGSLSGADTKKMNYIWIPLLIGMVPIFLLRWKINVLTLDDEEAKTMGINTRVTRTIVILAATLLTAASVSVSGIIGWVGLVMPHIARKFVGDDCRILIPASALIGGIFLLLVDDLARNLYTIELPLGILTSLIGAPFFLYLMLRRRE
jgi:iron complex transport system permease protein